MPTLICVPIMVDDVGSALADAALARDLGADLVEFRIDELFTGEGDDAGETGVRRLCRETALPCILTCRPTWEGGAYDGDEPARIGLLERLAGADHPPRYIDLELAALARTPGVLERLAAAMQAAGEQEPRTSLILSAHDFESRPTDLQRRILAMRSEPAASVHKIAFRARSLRDNLELLDLAGEGNRPTIALGMGEFGLLSRVLAPKFGGFLTFAALRAGAGTAPGQPTLADLDGLYRFRSIGRRTRVFGVIGWPVAQSMSPLVHNAAFEQRGFDGVYLPMPVAEGYEPLKATVLSMLDHAGLNFRGASVTIPHKESLFRLAEEMGWEIDEAGRRAAAVNTLARGDDGSVRVANTDAPAAAACLEDEIGALASKRVAVIGAGGVARGVVGELVARGATVTVYNRTQERAERLVADVPEGLGGRAVAASLDLLPQACAHAFVNCTSVGMRGGPDPDAEAAPVRELKSCEPGAVFFDTVYNPLRTPMLRAAEDAGYRTIDGARMFVRQAALQFEMWTGAGAPVALMDRLVRERLGG